MLATLLRSARTSLLMLLLLSAALLGLALLERAPATTERGGTTTPVFELSKKTEAEKPPKDKDKDKHAHCTDGKGRDGEKNPHCQLSG